MFLFSQWFLIFIGVIGYGLLYKHETEWVSPRYSYTRLVPNKTLFWLTTLIIAWFAGSIFANDVYIYRMNYVTQYPDADWAYVWRNGLGGNPLFNAIQGISYNNITQSAEIFQMLWIGFAQILFMYTYRHYSVSMPLTIFMFICSGLLYFTAVSWKQSMAMAIGFAATPLVFKRQLVIYYGILLIAMMIHPYIILFGVLPLFVGNKIWTRKSILILIAMLVTGNILSNILDTALEVTANVFGDEHDAKWFSEDYGVRPERVIFYAICPVFAIIYRKRLDVLANPKMNAMIQMSVISFGFMAMSLGGGANFISRMGNYFEPFTYIALPYILLKIVPSNNRTLMLSGIITIYLVFFIFLRLKYGSIW